MASCLITGDNFSPKLFENKNSVSFAWANEPGEAVHPGVEGAWGMPLKHGSASIKISNKPEENWGNLMEFLRILESCLTDLKESGAEDIALMMSLFHDGQCNFGFSPEELAIMTRLGITLSISCYGEEALPG